jgi:putative SOS response-associated peptidase YedK
MCGRYTVFTEEEVIEMREIMAEINRRYIGTAELTKMKAAEVFPTDYAPVLTLGSNGREARLMSWGFPKWQGPGVVFNARSETAGEKAMFRNALERRRCVVPSAGFFEWKHEGGKKKKDKYLLTLPGEKMLYMAGFYGSFRDKLGKPYDGFVILTAEACESMAKLHDRMPVILSSGQLQWWLEDADAAREVLVRQKDVEFLMRQVPA